MKKNPGFRMENWILCTIILVLSVSISRAQEVYARVLYSKVESANIEPYLKLIRENVKPALQQAKKNGSITDWGLYQIHNVGTEDEYNFVSVLYYDSWAKTEKLPELNSLTKQINPKATGNIMQSLSALRKVVRQDLFRRVDVVGAPGKFAVISFMKPTPGMGAEYLAVEKELWHPIHEEVVKSGAATGWGLWQIVFPSGTSRPYSYATSNLHDDYAKMNTVNIEEAAKKAHPGKKIEEIADRTYKSRQQVRVELWELVEQTGNETVAKN